MIFKIQSASVLGNIKDYEKTLFKFNYNKELKTIVINDLNELLKLQMLLEYSLIITNHNIEIYDGYIE